MRRLDRLRAKGLIVLNAKRAKKQKRESLVKRKEREEFLGLKPKQLPTLRPSHLSVFAFKQKQESLVKRKEREVSAKRAKSFFGLFAVRV
jgi:hypothetical protein